MKIRLWVIDEYDVVEARSSKINCTGRRNHRVIVQLARISVSKTEDMGSNPTALFCAYALQFNLPGYGNQPLGRVKDYHLYRECGVKVTYAAWAGEKRGSTDIFYHTGRYV